MILRPRDTRQAALEATLYSRFVGWLRWGLPLAGALFLAGLIIFPLLRSWDVKDMGSVAPNLVVDNLRLSGVDTAERPYSLTSDKVTYAPNASHLVDLDKPQGEITLKDGAWLAGKAIHGRYDMDAKKLWLGGNVQFFHDEGYEFMTDEAQVDMKQNTAWGDDPVEIQGAFGTIKGKGFKILDKGKIFVIEGHAEAKLNLRRSQASDKPEAREDKGEKAP